VDINVLVHAITATVRLVMRRWSVLVGVARVC